MGLRAGAEIAAGLMLAAAPVVGAPPTQVYSSACYHDESGDDLGTEVVLTQRVGKPPAVQLSLCEGVCSYWPVKDVRLAGKTLTFTAYREELTIHFTAKLGSKAMVLRSDNPDAAPERLPHRSKALVPTRVWGECR
jgi:hypothetical protein